MKLLLTSDIDFHELLAVFRSEGNEVNVCLLKDAVASVGHADMDVVLLDFGQSRKRGLKTLRELKVRRPDVPVIVMTDSGAMETAVQAFRFGAKDYFKKPFNLLELKEAIANVVRLRNASKERRFPHMTREGDVPALFLAATSSMSPQVLRAVSLMADNLSEDISLVQIAGEAGMSKYHFCRTFKTEVGMSPMRFFTAMRIERAKKLLRESAISASEAAFEVGFNDLSNFINHFKKITGQTPKAYRKSLKNPFKSNIRQ